MVCYVGIKQNEYNELVQYMCAKEFLREAEGVLVPGIAAEKRYLSANWRNLFAVFNAAPLYEVLEGRTQVGTLDTAFVAGIEIPFFFILAGRLWHAEKVDHRSRIVKARRASAGNAPKWDSFGGPDVPFETAQRVGELLHGFRELPPILDESANAVLKSMCTAKSSDSSWSPRTVECIVLSGGKAILRTYAGDTLNRTLAKLLESRGLRVRGNYADVTIEKGPHKREHLRDLVLSALSKIADKSKATNFMEESLMATQYPWLFSPFASMLPKDLLKAALVDLTTDREGLRSFLENRID